MCAMERVVFLAEEKDVEGIAERILYLATRAEEWPRMGHSRSRARRSLVR